MADDGDARESGAWDESEEGAKRRAAGGTQHKRIHRIQRHGGEQLLKHLAHVEDHIEFDGALPSHVVVHVAQICGQGHMHTAVRVVRKVQRKR